MICSLEQLPVQPAHGFFQLLRCCGIVEHLVGGIQSLLSAGLGGQHRAGVGCIDVIPLAQSPDLFLFGNIDHDHAVGVGEQAGLHQQRDDDHDVGLSTGLGDSLANTFHDAGMEECFELLSAFLVREHLLTQKSPVQCSVSGQDLRTEMGRDCIQGGRTRLDKLPRDQVGVDHLDTEAGKTIRRRGLAAGHAAGENHQQGTVPLPVVVFHFQVTQQAGCQPSTGDRR